MDYTDLLKSSIEATYAATFGLLELVNDDELDWKPQTGENWMTTGQLLMHLPTACGACCKGFLTGDWGMPEGMSMDDLSPEDMLPPAEKLPAVESVARARELLEQDKQLALKMVDEAGEEDLHGKKIAPPWEPNHVAPLGDHFLGMVQHLATHKAQLFYYLKLMGKPVDTRHLWGM